MTNKLSFALGNSLMSFQFVLRLNMKAKLLNYSTTLLYNDSSVFKNEYFLSRPHLGVRAWIVNIFTARSEVWSHHYTLRLILDTGPRPGVTITVCEETCGHHQYSRLQAIETFFARNKNFTEEMEPLSVFTLSFFKDRF